MFSSPMTVRKPNEQNGRTGGTDKRPEDTDIDAGYYVHQKKLGEGGFGSVRLGTHLKTGQKVAIKMMRKASLGNDLFRVKIEVQALKTLNHKHIAKLLQVIETTEDVYLVLEYCSGGELFDFLVSKHRLIEDEARDIFRQLVEVLDYIHDRGVAHRDLKPENILFDKNREIKLIDFGLSALFRDKSQTSAHLQTCCGSPAYAAPELFKGTGYLGTNADVWSAGILLYALLVGKLPFDDENLPNLYRKIQYGKYEIPRFLSKDVQNLLDCMLQTDPNKRITIKEIRRHRWLRSDNESATNVDIIESKHLQVLELCRLYFPEVPINRLEQNIKGFGYEAATYRLICNNPLLFESLISDIKPRVTVHRRRSKSVSDFTKNSGNSPKIIGAKRKIDCETLKEFQIKTPIDKISPKVRDTSVNSPTRIPVLRKGALQSPQVKASLGLPIEKTVTGCAVTPAKNPRILTPSNRSGNNAIFRTIGKTFSSKHSGGLAITTSTPPKKSFMKRLLESATPAKRQVPRLVTASSGEKNITLTQFTDPQKCVDSLIETLKARGVQCTQKSNFSLRCVLSSMNTIVLVFSLEVCKYGDKLAIHRKRLKGDSWNYKRICEDIIKFSNQLIQ